MNNENKLDRIGVQLQNEPLTISFVSTFCLGCRLLRHRSRDHEIIQHETFKKKSMGVGWGKFYEHGAEAGPCGKRGRPSFMFCRMCNFSKCKKMKPSPLDAHPLHPSPRSAPATFVISSWVRAPASGK